MRFGLDALAREAPVDARVALRRQTHELLHEQLQKSAPSCGMKPRACRAGGTAVAA
jgi:hypothetical protein